eukprot:7175418-Prymnesium_polylepis.1
MSSTPTRCATCPAWPPSASHAPSSTPSSTNCLPSARRARAARRSRSSSAVEYGYGDAVYAIISMLND